MIWRVNSEASGLYSGGTMIQRHLLVDFWFSWGGGGSMLSSMDVLLLQFITILRLLTFQNACYSISEPITFSSSLKQI